MSCKSCISLRIPWKKQSKKHHAFTMKKNNNSTNKSSRHGTLGHWCWRGRRVDSPAGHDCPTGYFVALCRSPLKYWRTGVASSRSSVKVKHDVAKLHCDNRTSHIQRCCLVTLLRFQEYCVLHEYETCI